MKPLEGNPFLGQELFYDFSVPEGQEAVALQYTQLAANFSTINIGGETHQTNEARRPESAEVEDDPIINVVS
ncbi:MAG: hypothetical protein ACRECH_17520 [Nitrososphaerales archaeon]